MKVFEKRPLLLLLCTVMLISLYLPLSATADEVFFPFISGLRVAVREDSVRLTWRDVPGYTDSYLVFRHTEVISESNINAAQRIGRIEPEVERFTDLPAQSGDYYYAVLTEEQPGRPLAVFIPFRNHTVRPVTIQHVAESVAAANVAELAGEAKQNNVILSFTADRSGRRLAVLRATSPITDSEDILSATLLGIIEASEQRYTDSPPQGVSYYYGIFDAELIGTDDLVIRPGENATTSSIVLDETHQETDTEVPEIAIPLIPEPVEPVGPAEPIDPERVITDEDITGMLARRLSDYQTQPLPLLQSRFSVVQQTNVGGFPMTMPDRQTISTETEKALDRLSDQYEPSRAGQEFEPALLSPEHDLWHRSARLESIVEDAFATGRWNQAYRELTDLLDSTISEELEQHARFYRGQLLLFLDHPEDAFFDLLLVQDSFYAEVQPMIEIALRKMQL